MIGHCRTLLCAIVSLRPRPAGLALLLCLSCLLGAAPHANAALSREDIERLLDEQFMVGEMQPDMQVYPLFAKNPQAPEAKPELKGYAFETQDFAGVRGYSGKPINMLVAIDMAGTILAVRLGKHKEPIFIRPEGHAMLATFARQLEGLTLRHHIEIGKASVTPTRDERHAFLHGVTTGTISAKAISRTVVTAVAAVVSAKLKLALPDNDLIRLSEPEPKPQQAWEPPPETPETSAANAASANKPTKANMVAGVQGVGDGVDGSGAGRASAGTQGVTASGANAGADRDAIDKANTSAGKDGSSAADAAANPLGAGSATGSASGAVDGDAGMASANGSTGAKPVSSFLANLSPDAREWLAQWQERQLDIGILLAGLALLSVGLIAQHRLSANAARLRRLRTLYLLFTVGFIGWYAQGQLTIVNLTASIESLSSGGDLGFLMNDPMTVILWLFVGISLLVWGRGTFCGWLCPFGALQELISLIANAVGVRQRRLRAALDARLKWIKYGVLAVLLLSVQFAPSFAEVAVEIEPFKTAISTYFQREWPFVLWALACLALGVVVYRGYCRYLCPLGAALASVDFLRRWGWIWRRAECGTPCQSCRHRCEYQAIEQTGKINYRECFQCLDCVSIYQDDERCLPLIIDKKRMGKTIPISVAKELA